jgi:hypothetical protein
MNISDIYRRRADECFAFARSARDEQERAQLLIMANTLKRIALDHERKSVQPSKSQL